MATYRIPIDLDLRKLNQKTAEISGKLRSLLDPVAMKIEADAGQAKQAFQKVSEEWEGIGAHKVTIEGNADAALQAAKQAKNGVNSVPDKHNTKFTGEGKSLLDTISKVGIGLFGMVNSAKMAAGAISGAFEPFIKSDTSMRKVNTLINLNAEQLEALRRKYREVGSELGDTAHNVNEAAYQAISAGVAAADSADFAAVARKSAIAGAASTTEAVDTLTNVINSYKLGIGQSMAVSDQLFTIVKRGKTEFGPLGASLSGVLPAAAALGIEFKYVGGALATMTKQGVQVGEATTKLQAFINAILRGQDKAKQMGGAVAEAFSIDALKEKGLQRFMQDLNVAVGGSQEKMLELLGRTEAVQAMLLLTGDNAKMAAADLAEMENAGGATEAAFAQMEKSAEHILKSVAANWSNLLNELVVSFGPTLLEIVDGLSTVLQVATDMVTFVQDNGETFLTWAAAIGVATIAIKAHSIWAGILAIKAKIATGATTLWSASTHSLNAAIHANPVGFIVGGIVLLIAAIHTVIKKTIGWKAAWLYAVGGIRMGWEYLKAFALFLVKFGIGAIKVLTYPFQVMWNTAKSMLSNVGELMKKVFSGDFKGALSQLKDGFVQGFHATNAGIKDAFSGAGDAFDGVAAKADGMFAGARAAADEYKGKQKEVTEETEATADAVAAVNTELENTQPLLVLTEEEVANLQKKWATFRQKILDGKQTEAAKIAVEFEAQKDSLNKLFASGNMSKADYQAAIAELMAWREDKMLELAEKTNQKLADVEANYYEQAKFSDANYLDWKQEQIEKQVAAQKAAYARELQNAGVSGEQYDLQLQAYSRYLDKRAALGKEKLGQDAVKAEKTILNQEIQTTWGRDSSAEALQGQVDMLEGMLDNEALTAERRAALEETLQDKRKALVDTTNAAIEKSNADLYKNIKGFIGNWSGDMQNALLQGKMDWQQFAETGKRMFVKILVDNVIKGISTMLTATLAANKIKNASNIKTAATEKTSIMSTILLNVKSAGAKMLSAVAEGFKWLVSTLGPFGLAAGIALGGGLIAAFSNFKSALGFARGGKARGGEQIIRINEEGEEFITNARATRKHESALEVMNRGGSVLEIIRALLNGGGSLGGSAPVRFSYAEGGRVNAPTLSLNLEPVVMVLNEITGIVGQIATQLATLRETGTHILADAGTMGLQHGVPLKAPTGPIRGATDLSYERPCDLRKVESLLEIIAGKSNTVIVTLDGRQIALKVEEIATEEASLAVK